MRTSFIAGDIVNVHKSFAKQNDNIDLDKIFISYDPGIQFLRICPKNVCLIQMKKMLFKGNISK